MWMVKTSKWLIKRLEVGCIKGYITIILKTT